MAGPRGSHGRPYTLRIRRAEWLCPFGMTEQQLNRPRIFRAFVDQRRLGAAHGGPELAVDLEIEERQFPALSAFLQPYPDRPDFLGLEESLLSDQLSLIPRVSPVRGSFTFHYDLPVRLSSGS